MSRWNDTFQNHVFKGTWSSIQNVLADSSLEINNNEQAVKEIGRLVKVVTYISSVIEQIDPELIPISHLDAFNQHATNCLSELNAFKGSQNIGHLQNANTHIDNVIKVFAQTPFNISSQQKNGMAKAASAYAEILDKHLVKLSDAVDNEIDRLKEKSNTLHDVLSKTDATLAALREQLNMVSQTIQAQTAEFNTQFQSGEKNRADKADASIDKLQNKMDEQFKELSIKAGITVEVLSRLLYRTSGVR